MLDIRTVETGRRSCDDVPTQGQALDMEHSRMQTKSDPLELCGWSRGRPRIGQSEMRVSGGMETSKMIRNKARIGTMS